MVLDFVVYNFVARLARRIDFFSLDSSLDFPCAPFPLPAFPINLPFAPGRIVQDRFALRAPLTSGLFRPCLKKQRRQTESQNEKTAQHGQDHRFPLFHSDSRPPFAFSAGALRALSFLYCTITECSCQQL